MDVENIYHHFLEADGVTTDSRDVPENSIFFALKGEHFNGNQYAGEAIKKGASYAIVDEQEWANNNQCILVDNVLTTLQELAHYHRQKMKAKIIAITGSNGKTTTKELAYSILSSSFNVLTNIKNYNNHIGVPLTLLNLKSTHEYGIIEMGANHQGEIERLCRIADPEYGLITNIGKAHLEGFGSFEGVKKAKGELYDYLSKKKGVVFYNRDNSILKDLVPARDCKVISYGTNKNSTCKGELTSIYPFLNIKYKDQIIQTRLIGKYNFENGLAAMCIGEYLGVPKEKIKHAVENYVPSNNRSQIIKTSHNKIILDAYNANPTSMQAAITTFKEIPGENKVLILGDMFELGEYSKEEHSNMVKFLHKQSFERIFLVGKLFSSTSHQEYDAFQTTEEFIEHLKAEPLKDKTILIKGSRGMALEKVTAYL